jgi:hypothetical protein
LFYLFVELDPSVVFSVEQSLLRTIASQTSLRTPVKKSGKQPGGKIEGMAESGFVGQAEQRYGRIDLGAPVVDGGAGERGGRLAPRDAVRAPRGPGVSL